MIIEVIDKAIDFLHKVNTRVKKFTLKKKFEHYKSLMSSEHPFFNFPMELLGDASADPTEFFNYYDAFAFWLFKKVREIGSGKRILDLGNKKMCNALLSLENEVYAIVLKDCKDKISNVNWVVHDVVKPLPFPDHTFDIFTSASTLHLVGLGRYGDEINPNTLLNFISELDRVMKKESHLIFCSTYGKNFLRFNDGWVFDIDTWKKLFGKWELVDWLIDNWSGVHQKNFEQRFTKDLSLDGWCEGWYRVIFLHFMRR
jgi:hypothetical protein